MLRDQAELVDLELAVARMRIRGALADREAVPDGERRPASAWLAEIEHAERSVEERIAATAAMPVELPLVWLRTRLGLGRPELRLIWTLLAHELSADSRAMLRQLNTEQAADPTTDTLRRVVFGPATHADASRLLSSTSALVRGGLIERTDADALAPEHRRTWKVSRRIVALVQGDLDLDPDLFRIASVVLPSASGLGIGGEGIEADPEALPKLVAALRIREDGGRTLIVQGPRGHGRRSLLRVAAAQVGLELLEVNLERLSPSPATARAQLAALARECRLFRRLPLLRDLDALVPTPSAENDVGPVRASVDRLEMITDALEGMFVLATTSKVVPGNRLHRPQIVSLADLTGWQRARLWTRAFPGMDLDDIDQLATMFPIAPGLISAVASVAREQLAVAGRDSIRTHIRTGLRATLDGQMARWATRIETSQDWSALVLPKEQRDALGEMIARIRRRRTVYEVWELGSYFGRGLGVSALFAGPPGTGKTMAAGLIASELATDLYQVDMSKIVSKWIGETEKNLAALFDAAEAGNAILLFDEADALFGKRTDVKSSNDRHANQETNYLLQRLEAFRGICILTTNHETAIDDAFKRRIALHVQFPMPEMAERVELWRTMVRSSIPTEGNLDFPGLARRFEMSGGHIRNAVLRAAFYAADEERSLTSAHLVRAALLEYQAMGRIMSSNL